MKKNVCLFIDNLTGGGAEKKILIIAEQMVAMGHGAHVVMMNDVVAYPVPEGVHCHALYPAAARNLDLHPDRRAHHRYERAGEHRREVIDPVEVEDRGPRDPHEGGRGQPRLGATAG